MPQYSISLKPPTVRQTEIVGHHDDATDWARKKTEVKSKRESEAKDGTAAALRKISGSFWLYSLQFHMRRSETSRVHAMKLFECACESIQSNRRTHNRMSSSFVKAKTSLSKSDFKTFGIENIRVHCLQCIEESSILATYTTYNI